MPKPPAAERYRRVDQPGPRTPGLRTVPGGYDLDPLPLHLPPQEGEAVVSWLRRLSVRYDVPARDLIRSVGSRQPITNTPRAAARLRNNRIIGVRLGLTADEVRTLVLPQPLASATKTYRDTLHRGAPKRPQSRYCPQCLADPDPWWPDHWQTPLSLICLIHHCYLACACPGCGQRPQATTAWLARPVELHRCPSRLPPWQAAPGRQAPWCDTDLTKTPGATAPNDEVRAQQQLHAWAPGSAEPANACGTAITHRIGFQALGELLDASQSGTATDPLDLHTNPADLGPGLAAALHVLDQPTLDQAAAAAWMLPLDGAHAPTRPVSRITAHHYSPLLAAIQLADVRDRLPPAEQLTFRTGHLAPRYPTTTTPKTRRRLRLPDHRPNWPEPDPAWIPQTLWWNTIPAPLPGQPDRALHGSLLAMALARTGTTRDWADICTDLQLPASHADRINDFLSDAQRSSNWPTVLTALERLLTGLQQHPPPIDYPTRRRLGDDLDLLTGAVIVGQQRHPRPVPRQTLLRQFWERFTGGDIAYAPEPISIDPANPAYSTFRQTHTVASGDLFHIAHRHLRQITQITGPLTWRPGLLPPISPANPLGCQDG
ncbi:hypothetical protein GCM10009616_34730 [Microlunatus lacustris]